MPSGRLLLQLPRSVHADLPALVDQDLGTGWFVDIDRHGIVRDHRQLARKRLAQLAEQRQAAVVALDRDHLCPGAEQRAGQPAGAGADLEHRGAVQIAGNRSDAIEQLFVEQEILAERLARLQPMRAHRLAQRRQMRCGPRRHLAGAQLRSRAIASLAAMAIAAIVGPGSASPVPAMLNAVPWSGEVRMIGGQGSD